jgi:hypothetical protein
MRLLRDEQSVKRREPFPFRTGTKSRNLMKTALGSLLWFHSRRSQFPGKGEGTRFFEPGTAAAVLGDDFQFSGPGDKVCGDDADEAVGEVLR